ncbi:MAG: rod shape-determining protein RodA [Maricaulaceae bacterium]
MNAYRPRAGGSARLNPDGPLARLGRLDWALAGVLAALAGVGVAMLYSTADGAWRPWAVLHAVRFAAAFLIMIAASQVPLRLWAGMAYPAYFVALALLIGVAVVGEVGKGAQRWLEFGPIRLQPSEIMKIALVMALARFYHDLKPDRVNSLSGLAGAALLIGAPTLLIAYQPDLGTAVLVAFTGAGVMFLAGLSWRWIAAAAALGAPATAAFLTFGLQDYQRRRILTFLNPEQDPTGSGYHILQSKIALGSGGLTGKGFLNGSQAHLNFLPEKHTDFIFTMLGEEFGLVGGLALLALVALVLVFGFITAQRASQTFGRLLAGGVCITFALYVGVNAAMVMGLMPVVGVPFPLVSYGGTVMLSIMAGFGAVQAVRVYRDAALI